MRQEYGLDTDTALLKLKDIVRSEVCLFHQQHIESWSALIWRTFDWKTFTAVTWFGCIAVLIEITASIISLINGVTRSSSLVLTLLVVILCFAMVITCSIRESYLHKNEVERQVVGLPIEMDFAYKAYQAYAGLPDLTVSETNSITLVWTYRDNRIVNLPWNLLVEGDVIILGPSRMAPAYCRQLISSKENSLSFPLHLEAGEVFNPSIDQQGTERSVTPQPRQRFEVLQAPITTIIKSHLDGASQKNVSIPTQDMNAIVKLIECRVIWVLLLLSVLVNIIRWQFLPDNSGHLLERLLLTPSYTILPLLPLTFPCLWTMVTFYGTARLRTLFSVCTKLEILPHDSEDIWLEHIHLRSAIQVFYDILRGDAKGLPRTVNLLHTLGTITTFSCVDKEGILCDIRPSPEKVFFFKEHHKIKGHGSSNAFDTNVNLEYPACTANEGKPITNDVEILSLSANATNKDAVVFDDADWEDQLPSLRPLGLNMLVNSPCLYPMKSLREEDFIRHLSLTANAAVVKNFRGCMCPLSNEIGFQDGHNWFKSKQQIVGFRQLNLSESNTNSNFFLSIVKEKHVPFTVSTIVNDYNQACYQLLTQGSADLVLDECTDLWNGEDICKLTDQDRKKALNFFQRMNITRKCVAFSYRPVFDDTNDSNDVFVEISKDFHLDESEDEESGHEEIQRKISGEMSPKQKRKKWVNKRQKDMFCDDMLKPPFLSFSENQQLYEKITHKQIFLGMVTLIDTLKKDLVIMVEHLNTAGVRFVHFSYENELLSRVFCQRLGLETGWNCHISLGDSSATTLIDECSSSAISDSIPLLSHDEDADVSRIFRSCDTDTTFKNCEEDDDEQSNQVYENYDELYFMSDRSKLPHGIQNMRRHLDEVDDVPLLVPLFTDCNSAAISEMVEIMQDYGDVVCCIGSVLNSRNHKIFSQSDVAIGLEPVLHQACSQKTYDLQAMNLSVSDPDIPMNAQVSGLLSLSSLINSIPTSLSCNRTDSFPIGAILCEARRLTIGLRSCFLFLLSCQLSLSFLMLLSTFLLLPIPLTGTQILWMVCVILPILSLSLIGTPADKNLMGVITGKRREKRTYQELIYPYVQQFLPTFLLNVLFMATVLFPWLLFSFCQDKPNVECHWLLGMRNSTEREYQISQDHLDYSQELILCYITLTYIVLSMSFVHRTHQLWKKFPYENKPWCGSVITCFTLQLIYTISSIKYHQPLDAGINAVPPYWYAVAVLWLMVLIFCSEMLKRKYIRIHVRFQKREKLKFDTKLGMNSPV